VIKGLEVEGADKGCFRGVRSRPLTEKDVDPSFENSQNLDSKDKKLCCDVNYFHRFTRTPGLVPASTRPTTDRRLNAIFDSEVLHPS
jgi:hypothetical protein